MGLKMKKNGDDAWGARPHAAYLLKGAKTSDGPPKGTNQQESHRSAMDIMQCNPNGWFPLAGKSCIIDDIRTEKPK
jgi:hypothetical protein